MSIAEFLKDPPPAVQPQTPQMSEATKKLRKQVFVGFGSIAVLGLALIGAYVAFRILAGAPARPPAVSTVATVVKPSVQTAPPAVKPVAPATTVPPPAPPMVSVPIPLKRVEPPVVLKPVPKTKPQPVAAGSVAVKPAATNVVKATAPAVTPALVEAPPARSTHAGPFERHDLSPHHGERYLQIAAYGPRSLDAYLKVLEGQGLRPLVAPGPADNIYRVVIGPFPNSDALEKARRSIQAEGIDPILRSY